MRCSTLIPVAVIIASATASVVPKFARAPNGLLRRQDACAASLADTQQQISACNNDFQCVCGMDIDEAVQQTTQACVAETDTTTLATVQQFLNDWANNCVDTADASASAIDSSASAEATDTATDDGADSTDSADMATTTPAATSATPALTTSAPAVTAATIKASPSPTTSVKSGAAQIKGLGLGALVSVFAVVVALL